jgi:hypothetical protein
MRPRTLVFFALAALMGAAVVVLPALAAAPSEAKLEINENCVHPAWPCWAAPGSGANPSPASKVTIAPGGEVSFVDHTSTKVNIAWTGTAPACSPSVPVSPTAPQALWEGKCKFEQPGTYMFESKLFYLYTKYEIVVEAVATGTTPTTTSTSTTPTGTSTTPSEPGSGSHLPLEGISRTLTLAPSQRGSTVHGSIKVPQADSGGRLEVGLFAAGASLARTGHSQLVRVGRLVRSSLKAGRVSFSVSLSTKAKASLRRHRRLALTVKIRLTPVHSAPVTATRVVVLHA